MGKKKVKLLNLKFMEAPVKSGMMKKEN